MTEDQYNRRSDFGPGALSCSGPNLVFGNDRRKNREIPMDVLNPEVREILLELCGGKRVDDYVFANPDTDKPFTDIKRSFHTACRLAGIEGLWWHDLRATFCTRLALAGYEALTIMMLMDTRI